jgi:thiol-disulfide isomerase/thioredoxin
MRTVSILLLGAVVTGLLGWVVADSVGADDGVPTRGAQPRLLIASAIDGDGNLILSGTEQRERKIVREVDKNGKKTTEATPMTYPVVVLNRQVVSLKDVTIYESDGKQISIDQARQRLKEPAPVLLTFAGEKLDPIYLRVVSKDTLLFAFAGIPRFKELPTDPHGGHATAAPPRKGIVTVGEQVPELSVQTLDGKTLKLSELRKDRKRAKHGVVVLSFWCSTCSSCRRVEHHLDKLARAYEGEAAVIALDANADETAGRVAAFARDKGLTMPIVLDPSGRTADVFGADVTTTTVVIDRHGGFRYCGRFRGGDGAAYAEDALKAVLAGKEVAVKTTPHDG